MEALHTGITEDELMALGPDRQVEVIDGELVEMSPVGLIHHAIVMNILRILDNYVLQHGIGYVYPDGLIFLLHREGTRLKGAQVPDVCFIRTGNIPLGWNFQRPLPGAPNLAVEVMSPDDKAELIRVRTRRYLEAGTEQVWVVYPETHELHQFQMIEGAETVRIYQHDQSIDVDVLFPGLKLHNSAIFQLPPWEEARLKASPD